MLSHMQKKGVNKLYRYENNCKYCFLVVITTTSVLEIAVLQPSFLLTVINARYLLIKEPQLFPEASKGTSSCGVYDHLRQSYLSFHLHMIFYLFWKVRSAKPHKNLKSCFYMTFICGFQASLQSFWGVFKLKKSNLWFLLSWRCKQ